MLVLDVFMFIGFVLGKHQNLDFVDFNENRIWKNYMESYKESAICDLLGSYWTGRQDLATCYVREVREPSDSLASHYILENYQRLACKRLYRVLKF